MTIKTMTSKTMAIKTMNTFNYHALGRSLLAVALLFISIFVHAEQLTASVDRNEISIQETFTLTIAANSRASGAPDFSQLKNDFEILSNNQSQFTSITNSGAEFKKVWQLTLAPKRAGKLLIPSFNVDNSVSDAIEINVSQKTQTQTNSDESVRVNIEVNKSDVHVQEQILVTIKLISQVNLSQAEMQPLEIKNAVLIPLSEKPKQYVSNINGKQHLILESTYALFPQESGELIIPSVIYSVVPNVERDLWNDPFGRNRANILRLPTEEQRIKVKPVPAEAAGKTWQPATNVTLHETWSASLDHLKMGEPVTRTITITAEGLTGGQIAPLPTNTIDGLTFYPDQPQNTDSKTTKGIEGTRVETTAIIPNHGGEFTLPEVSIEWWDVNSQSIKTATLPEKKINVLGDAAPTANSTQTTSANAGTSAGETQNTKTEIVTQANPWLWASTVLFALMALVLSVYVFHLKARLTQLQAEQEKADAITSEKEKHIWDLLKHSAANKNASELRKHILSWAKFQWPEVTIHSLDDVAKLAGKLELTQALKKLDELLYSNHPDDNWAPQEILNLLNECRKERNLKKTSEELKSLYNN
jgi:hypothetical protein